MNRIANEVYSQARSGSLTIDGFPDFSPTVSALNAAKGTLKRADYKVTVNKGGNLVVLEAYAAKWVDCEQTKERAQELITQHNQKYNPEGEFWLRTGFWFNTSRSFTHVLSCFFERSDY